MKNLLSTFSTYFRILLQKMSKNVISEEFWCKSSYSIRILMSHSLTHSLTHSLSHSAKSVFKFDQNFFMSQTYRSYYAFNVPHLKFDLRKRIFGFLMKNFAYRILPGSPSEYQPCVWGGLLSTKCQKCQKLKKSRIG